MQRCYNAIAYEKGPAHSRGLLLSTSIADKNELLGINTFVLHALRCIGADPLFMVFFVLCVVAFK